jgi:hypothetical protein
MNTNFRERFLNNLTDTASEIMRRYAQGEKLSDNETKFLLLYLREIDRYEEKPLSQKILDGADKIMKFAKENLSGLLASGTEASVDDYVINTEEET